MTLAETPADAPDTLRYALGYARRGWPVCPLHTPTPAGCSCRRADCPSIGKHPRLQNGILGASRDPDVISGWWAMWPAANLAIATGRGLFVLDVDPSKGGADSLDALEEQHGKLPPTVQAITGTGSHFLFAVDREVRCSASKFRPGLDVRGDGGYIVAPPSLHRNGRRYGWELSAHPRTVPLAPCPPWLLDLATLKPAVSGPATVALIVGGRNDGLYRLGCSWRAKGLEGEELEAVLLAANRQRCNPPLDESEVRTIIRKVSLYTAPGLSPEYQRVRAVAEQRAAHGEATAPRLVVEPSPEAPDDTPEDPEGVCWEGLDVVASPPGDPTPPAEPEPGPETSQDARIFQRGDAPELARALLADLRGDSPAEVVFDRGRFWRYDAPRGLWALLDDAAPHCAVGDYAGGLVWSEKGPKALRLSASDVAGAVKMASRYADRPGFFDDAPRGLLFANGFVFVEGRTLAIAAFDPAHRATHALPFAFDAHAPAARWEAAVRAMFVRPGDAELAPGSPEAAARAQDIEACVDLLHEFVGGALFGLAVRFAVCLVLLGGGDNGKSTVLKVFKALVPESAFCAIAPQRWGNSFYLAELAGKRVNLVSELPERDILDAEVFKAVITGDPTTADQKYGRPFTLVPQAGHVFAANKLPGTRDQSEGFWRRFAVLYFGRKFTEAEKIPDLDKLLIAEELPGIAALLVTGAHRLLTQNRYTLPESSQDAKLAWQLDTDQVRQWIADHATPDPDAETALDVLYQDYAPWAKAAGHAPLSRTTLGSRIQALGHYHRTKIARFYTLTVKDPPEAATKPSRYGRGIPRAEGT